MDMQGDLVVLFHGPDIFDKGYAKDIICSLSDANFFQAGTMGRTAAHDNGLDNVFSIPDLPSKVVARSKDNIGSLLIAICPRSIDSGKSFVKIILENSGIKVPVMHLDFTSNSYVIWQGDFPRDLLENVRSMGLEEDFPLDKFPRFTLEGNMKTRHLRNCKPGDFVLCKNILIGRANDSNVSITVQDGRIVGTHGIDVKEHGIEKLELMGPLDIAKAKCCTTSNLRGDVVIPRIKKRIGEGVVFINHAGSEVYELSEGCEGAVVVGDDTSRIVGDILFRFDMPVIAITDGDKDGLIKHDRFTERSVLYEVDHDDEVGSHLFKELFKKCNKLDLPFDEVKGIIGKMISDRIRDYRYF